MLDIVCHYIHRKTHRFHFIEREGAFQELILASGHEHESAKHHSPCVKRLSGSSGLRLGI